MGIIKSIKYCGKEPVYNITVRKHHNYFLKGGVLSKNCDSLRCFCIWWVRAPLPDRAKDDRPKWREDLIEDYKHASREVKELMVRELGEPRL